IRVNNGQLFLRDRAFRTATTQRATVLSADVSRIGGEIQVNGARPTIFRLAMPLTELETTSQKAALRAISLSGEADADGQWALANLRLPDVTLPPLAAIAWPRGDVVVQRG